METRKLLKVRIYAHADRRGVISFTRKPDEQGLLLLGSGFGSAFRNMVGVVARHAFDGKTLLVSGVPEARDDKMALEAVEHFRMELLRRQMKTSKLVKH